MKKILSLIMIFLTLLFVSTALATTYTESVDASETLASAQLLPGGTDLVLGSLSSDADLYEFGWGGGDFYANSAWNSIDFQLFLFNESGVGVQGNDDGIAYAGPAYLQVAALAAGMYYIGISAYDYDPYSSAGLIFTSYPYEPLYSPLNLQPLSYWDGSSSDTGSYGIYFRQVTDDGQQGPENPTNGVPEPSSLLLLGLGLLGLGLAKRKS